MPSYVSFCVIYTRLVRTRFWERALENRYEGIFGKSGNFSLLSYFEYAESKNVSCQISFDQKGLKFSLLK